MLTTIFRIGPLVILEFSFTVAAVIIPVFTNLPPCAPFTLGYLTLILFLIEMIASLRMTKSNPSLRRHHLFERVAESHLKYYLRSVWDNINILTVIMLLYYSQVADGFTLYRSTQVVSTEPTDDECEFTLFALCLFKEL